MLFVAFFMLSGQAWAQIDTRRMGDYFQMMVPSYALGLAVSEDGWTATKQLGLSMGSMQLSVMALKYTINEKRPDYVEGDRKDSFPSGHTAMAFSGATFVHKRYGLKRAAIPYLMATYTGYSRVATDKHYIHDVIAGAMIASFWTWLFVDKIENIVLTADTRGVAITYVKRF
ncbi:phosphatase PAP2 family protein [Deferribacterales bacterium RsTz2092]|nr:phosphoesterase [Deferribacterales bacterium]